MNFKKANVLAVIFAMMAISIPSVSAQKSSRAMKAVATTEAPLAPTPRLLEGNPNCKALNEMGLNGDPDFDHIEDGWELKLENNPPPSGFTASYSFSNGTTTVGGTSVGRFLVGPVVPLASVTVTRSGDNINWNSTLPITGVIIKNATKANVYPYDPSSFGGNPDGFGLSAPGNPSGISHITFCFQSSLIPSASPGSIMGRVTGPTGRGLSKVTLISTNLATGEIRRVSTNTFGYYFIEDLELGSVYSVGISSKTHRFVESVRTVVLNDNLEGFDFVAIE